MGYISVAWKKHSIPGLPERRKGSTWKIWLAVSHCQSSLSVKENTHRGKHKGPFFHPLHHWKFTCFSIFPDPVSSQMNIPLHLWFYTWPGNLQLPSYQDYNASNSCSCLLNKSLVTIHTQMMGVTSLSMFLWSFPSRQTTCVSQQSYRLPRKSCFPPSSQGRRRAQLVSEQFKN